MIRKWMKFLRLPVISKLLFIEAIIFLAWARWRISRPFTKIAPSLGSSMLETSYSIDSHDEHKVRRQINRISKIVRMASKHTLWESKCLVQAMAAMKMLELRNIESTLYLGTGKDDEGKMIAHAWLRSGSTILTGAEMMNRFTVVAIFGKQVRRKVPVNNAMNKQG